MKNKKNYTLYICIEIGMLLISVVVGYLFYSIGNEMSVCKEASVLLGIFVGGAVLMALELLRRILSDE